MYKCSQNTIKKGSKVIQVLFRYYWMDVYHIVSCPYVTEFFIINSSLSTHFSALVTHFAEHKSDLKIWLQIWSTYTSIQLIFFFQRWKIFYYAGAGGSAAPKAKQKHSAVKHPHLDQGGNTCHGQLAHPSRDHHHHQALITQCNPLFSW